MRLVVDFGVVGCVDFVDCELVGIVVVVVGVGYGVGDLY